MLQSLQLPDNPVVYLFIAVTAIHYGDPGKEIGILLSAAVGKTGSGGFDKLGRICIEVVGTGQEILLLLLDHPIGT